LGARPAGGGRSRWTILGLFVATLLVLGWKIFSQAAPEVRLAQPLKGLGQSTPVAIEVADARHAIRRILVQVEQGGRSFTVLDSTLPRAPWWKFWSRGGENRAEITVHAGRKEIPALTEGRATLRVVATNDSWGRFFRGGRAVFELELPVRFDPPRVQVLSFPHYVNLGGSELIVFRVSPGTVESGVQVGDNHFFPSWPVREDLPETRLCLFAFPYNISPQAPARIVARDDVGNETRAEFAYRVFPKVFPEDTITLTDEFMSRVVPPILSQTPDLQDQGDLLKNFLMINGRLRETNAQQLAAFSRQTSPRFLWKQPFIQLRDSKVQASFADRRTYLYNGQAVDHQDHLGFDLAVTQQIPIVASNDGVVVHAGWLGIYGNAIVLDHGCGLQTLYAHLSSIDVKPADEVKRGQAMGRSGQTGLAAGDHLHFTTLLAGIPVNPIEWWDPHWIRDRIEQKLAPYR
jgi:murein DD-endopeptidase MepM/ murein hydrolase activator NlpD